MSSCNCSPSTARSRSRRPAIWSTSSPGSWLRVAANMGPFVSAASVSSAPHGGSDVATNPTWRRGRCSNSVPPHLWAAPCLAGATASRRINAASCGLGMQRIQPLIYLRRNRRVRIMPPQNRPQGRRSDTEMAGQRNFAIALQRPLQCRTIDHAGILRRSTIFSNAATNGIVLVFWCCYSLDAVQPI